MNANTLWLRKEYEHAVSQAEIVIVLLFSTLTCITSCDKLGVVSGERSL